VTMMCNCPIQGNQIQTENTPSDGDGMVWDDDAYGGVGGWVSGDVVLQEETSETPGAGLIPRAGGDGKISPGWLDIADGGDVVRDPARYWTHPYGGAVRELVATSETDVNGLHQVTPAGLTFEQDATTPKYAHIKHLRTDADSVITLNGDVTLPQVFDAVVLESPIDATLLNGWVNYGGDHQTCQYWKDPFGFVHLKGMIIGGGGPHFMTLPVGYRPDQILIAPLAGDEALSGGGGGSQLRAYPGGACYVLLREYHNDWVSFAATFPAADYPGSYPALPGGGVGAWNDLVLLNGYTTAGSYTPQWRQTPLGVQFRGCVDVPSSPSSHFADFPLTPPANTHMCWVVGVLYPVPLRSPNPINLVVSNHMSITLTAGYEDLDYFWLDNVIVPT